MGRIRGGNEGKKTKKENLNDPTCFKGVLGGDWKNDVSNLFVVIVVCLSFFLLLEKQKRNQRWRWKDLGWWGGGGERQIGGRKGPVVLGPGMRKEIKEHRLYVGNMDTRVGAFFFFFFFFLFLFSLSFFPFPPLPHLTPPPPPPLQIREQNVLKLFGKYGKVVRLDFLWHHTGPQKGSPRGYCFVEFRNRQVIEREREREREKREERERGKEKGKKGKWK